MSCTLVRKYKCDVCGATQKSKSREPADWLGLQVTSPPEFPWLTSPKNPLGQGREIHLCPDCIRRAFGIEKGGI